jgi:hypothetical protein
VEDISEILNKIKEGINEVAVKITRKEDRPQSTVGRMSILNDKKTAYNKITNIKTRLNEQEYMN